MTNHAILSLHTFLMPPTRFLRMFMPAQILALPHNVKPRHSQTLRFLKMRRLNIRPTMNSLEMYLATGSTSWISILQVWRLTLRTIYRRKFLRHHHRRRLLHHLRVRTPRLMPHICQCLLYFLTVRTRPPCPALPHHHLLVLSFPQALPWTVSIIRREPYLPHPLNLPLPHVTCLPFHLHYHSHLLRLPNQCGLVYISEKGLFVEMNLLLHNQRPYLHVEWVLV